MADKRAEDFTREKIIFVYEFVGTGLFVYFINMCQGHAFAIPLTLFLLGIIAGPVSGGLFNPAVAVGRFMICPDQRKEAITLIAYLAGQFLGGMLGFLLTYSSIFNIRETLDKPTAVPTEELLILAPHYYLSTRGAFMTEFIGTFLFVFIGICATN